MLAGEIYLGYFPFGGTLGRKLRPTLLLTGPQGTVPEYVAAYITSLGPQSRLLTDLLLDPGQPEFMSSGLLKTSWLRLHKLATLHESDLVRRLGVLERQTMLDVSNKLRQLFNL